MRLSPLTALLFVGAEHFQPSEFPGYDGINPGWRTPPQEPLGFSSGDYVPNPFDFSQTYLAPNRIALVDQDDAGLPQGIKFWGDHAAGDPYGGSEPSVRPGPAAPPLRFDEWSPLRQAGPHPLAESIPRHFATVNRQTDFVTKPQVVPQPQVLPRQVFETIGGIPSLSIRSAPQRRPHSRNRPRRNDPERREIKMSSQFARRLTLVFDVAEIAELFARIIKILMQPDVFSWTVGRQARFYKRNQKTERILRLIAFHVAEDVIVGAIRPRISAVNPNVLLQHL